MNNIKIEKSTVEHIDFILNSESKEENMQFINPWTKQQHLSAMSSKDIYHAVVFFENRLVGFIILAGLESPNNSIEFMRVVITEKGKGLGRDTLRWAKSFSFEICNANRLWLDVKTNNIRALSLYQSEGFKLEGTLREALKGKTSYESLHILSILQSEWKS